MAVVGSIHILTDRKAKVLTALKASLRAYESVISPDDAKKVGSLIDGEVFETVYNACADELSQDIAIYLSDDYVSVCYEDIELSELEKAFAKRLKSRRCTSRSSTTIPPCSACAETESFRPALHWASILTSLTLRRKRSIWTSLPMFSMRTILPI